MIRYRLDDLGWYQFEWLTQALLKAEHGLAVEAWGGSGDHGKDAYCSTPLRISSGEPQPGPFLFQAKFIQEANAPGAKVTEALLKAVGSEARRLPRHRSKWGEQPKHYVLLTNAPLTATLRDQIQGLISQHLTGAIVHSLGAGDVCDLLDKHETTRRSFPQLLSLRDLDQLLASVVNKEVLYVAPARSKQREITQQSSSPLRPTTRPGRFCTSTRSWFSMGRPRWARRRLPG